MASHPELSGSITSLPTFYPESVRLGRENSHRGDPTDRLMSRVSGVGALGALGGKACLLSVLPWAVDMFGSRPGAAPVVLKVAECWAAGWSRLPWWTDASRLGAPRVQPS